MPLRRSDSYYPIVFTDLAGSKQAMLHLPEHWVRRVLREHSALALRLATGSREEDHLAFPPTNLGDGNLFIFHELDEALLFSLRMARAWERRWRAEIAARLRSSRRLPPGGGGLRLRIGVHFGPVLDEQLERFRRGITFSRAINGAFVLQHQAPVGSVAVSETAASLVEGHLFRFRYLGRFDTLARSSGAPQEERLSYYELLDLSAQPSEEIDPAELLGFERDGLAREWFFRGMLAGDERGRTNEAVTCLRRCLRYRPGLSPAWEQLSRQLGNLGLFDEGVEAARHAIEAARDSAPACYTMSGLLERCGRLEEAREYCVRALELDPEFYMAHYNRGVIEVGLGDPTAAEAAFRRALELNGRLPMARYNLACLAASRGADEDALDELEKALELDPSLRAAAAGDDDLAPLRDEPRFRMLLGE